MSEPKRYADRPKFRTQHDDMKGDAMRIFIAVSILALLLIASPARAASLTLGCSGAVTTTEVPKNGVASEPQKESIADLSVIIDFDRRTVSGLWAEMNGLHTMLPITAADANSVTFKGTRKLPATASIEGTVDRVTGHTDANETVLWPNGSMSMLTYDLRCKPTKPLF